MHIIQVPGFCYNLVRQGIKNIIYQSFQCLYRLKVPNVLQWMLMVMLPHKKKKEQCVSPVINKIQISHTMYAHIFTSIWKFVSPKIKYPLIYIKYKIFVTY